MRFICLPVLRLRECMSAAMGTLVLGILDAVLRACGVAEEERREGRKDGRKEGRKEE